MAAAFRFRLETVRRLRSRAVDEQRAVVAERIRAVTEIEHRIDALSEQLQGQVGEARDAQCAPRLDVGALRYHEWYKGRLHRQLFEAGQYRATCTRQLENEREKLATANKRLKVIEKLRERRWTRYVTGRRREEQATMDEVSLQIYRRAAGGAGRSGP